MTWLRKIIHGDPQVTERIEEAQRAQNQALAIARRSNRHTDDVLAQIRRAQENLVTTRGRTQ